MADEKVNKINGFCRFRPDRASPLHLYPLRAAALCRWSCLLVSQPGRSDRRSVAHALTSTQYCRPTRLRVSGNESESKVSSVASNKLDAIFPLPLSPRLSRCRCSLFSLFSLLSQQFNWVCELTFGAVDETEKRKKEKRQNVCFGGKV